METYFIYGQSTQIFIKRKTKLGTNFKVHDAQLDLKIF